MLSEEGLIGYYETIHLLTQQAGRYTLQDLENSTPFDVEIYATLLKQMYEKRKQQIEQAKNRS